MQPVVKSLTVSDCGINCVPPGSCDSQSLAVAAELSFSVWWGILFLYFTPQMNC